MSADAPRPYTRGWRAPWRHQWGGLDDGHSRLSRLAKRIEGELAQVYAVTTPLDARRLRMAARYLALAERIVQTIGVDPKASPRRASTLQRHADGLLADLPRKASAPAAPPAVRVVVGGKA